MGAPLLPHLFGGLAQLYVEWALGADLNAASSSWTWYDITDYVVQAGGSGITITIGRGDEFQQASPGACAFQVRNETGMFSRGPQSPSYPYVKRNIPLRVRVDLGAGAGAKTRFFGYISKMQPSIDASGRKSLVDVEANGVTRRLSQGDTPIKSPLRYYIEGTTSPAIGAYWPLEDKDGSATLAAGLPGMEPATFTDLDLASNTGLWGSAPLPTFEVNTGSLFAVIDRTFNTGQWQIDFHCYMPSDPGSDTVVLQINSDGTLFQWNLWFCTGGSVKIVGYARDLSTPVDSLIGLYSGTTLYGQWVHFHFAVQDAGGGSTDWMFEAWPSMGGHEISANSGTYTGDPGNPSFVTVPAGANLGSYSIGHIVYYDAYAYTQAGNPAFGWNTERPEDRLQRVCDQIGVELEFLGDDGSAAVLGAQTTDTPFNVIREVETTDQGVLYDAMMAGLSYLCFNGRENASETSGSWNVDVSAGQTGPTFQPLDDDQRNRNYAKVDRKNGSSAEWEDSTGPMGDGPNGIGRYPDSVTVNTQTDTYLLPLAQWLVHMGTDESYYRYGQLDIDFANPRSAANAASWLTSRPGTRIVLKNIDDLVTQMPPDDIGVLIEGWTEFLACRAWRTSIVAGPERPWRIMELADTTGDTNEYLCHLDADPGDITLAADYAAGATSIVVNVSVLDTGLTISTTADDAPFDLDIGGWKVHVTAVGTPTTTATPPTLAGEYECASWTTTDATKTTTVAANAGDTLLILAGTDTDAVTLDVPYGGTSLDYESVQLASTSTYANAYAWTVAVPSNQTFVLGINNYGSTGVWGFTVMRFANSAGIGASAQTHVSSGAPSLALTTTKDHSVIATINMDTAGASGSSRTWRTINSLTPTAGNGLERVYSYNAGTLTAYAAYWSDAGTAGSKTTGLSAPGSEKYTIISVEVMGVVQQTLTVSALPAALTSGTAVQMWQPPVLGR